MELKIYIQKKQYFNVLGQPIYFTGPNPQSLTTQQGFIPNNQWADATTDVGNLDEISLTFSELIGESQTDLPGVTFVRRSASGVISIESNTYQFIKQWLINDVAAPLNAIAVKIEHVGCGTYENWQITRGQISYCEGNAICQFEVTLQQLDELYHCIQKTVISDNWQGMFDKAPANGKKHPRFSYCNEIRPNGTLIMQWWMTGVVISSTLVVMIPMILLLNSVFFIINIIIGVINTIVAIVGGNSLSSVNWQTIPYIDFQDILDSYRQYYVESAGCGREHPAPLIRDYIKNVCDKCGISIDAVTSDILFSPVITIEASSGLKTNVHNPHFMACYFYAPIKRGIRRFYGINYFGSPQYNNSEFYIPENSPPWALSDFLDQLKKVYNADWRIRKVGNTPYLYFWRRDKFIESAPVYDFTEGSPDREKILQGMCFEAYEVTFPASVNGMYSQDPIDTCGNEALRQVNGYAYSFTGNQDDIIIFRGILDSVTPDFGAAKFRLDGASTDYIYDAAQVVCNGQILQPWTIPQIKDVDHFMGLYANYALLIKDDTCGLGKILIWDGVDYGNAKCVRNIVPVNNYLVPNDPLPLPNTHYNSEVWAVKHPTNNSVIGQALTSGSTPNGVYAVKDYFGSIVWNNAARLVNYPMYFNPGYQDTIYDWFWWIDDPRLNPRMGLKWTVWIDLCCEDLNRCGVLNDASGVIIGQKVKIPIAFFPDGKVEEVTVSYKSSEEIGKFIELTGTI